MNDADNNVAVEPAARQPSKAGDPGEPDAPGPSGGGKGNDDAPKRRGRGWHFPELAGPDLSTEIFAGESQLWLTLDKLTIDELFEDVLGPDDDGGQRNPLRKSLAKRSRKRSQKPSRNPAAEPGRDAATGD